MDVEFEDEDQETLLYNLVYCSRSVGTIPSDELARLVAAAQKHNAREEITGWLVYSHGIFFQWLEGPREQVKRLMASISADARHTAVVTLSETEEMRGRVFSGWDMELVSADEVRAVLFDAIEASNDAKRTAVLQDLLKELDLQAVGQTA